MNELWWKISVTWLCAAGDWLWAYLAVPLLAKLEQLTFKRIVYLAAFMLLVIGFAQMVTMDLAIIWAGDTTFYLELASAVAFFVVRGRAGQALLIARHKIGQALQGAAAVMRRYGGIARQRRNANALRREKGAGRAKRSDDEPAAWLGGALISAGG